MPPAPLPTELPAAPGRTDVHLWCLTLDGALSGSARDRLARWLSADEQARHDRLRVETARTRFLSAHALARAVLARAEGTHPARLQFTQSEHGRPELAHADGGGRRLRFNLSHTPGMVAFGVALDRDIGVDVESRERIAGMTSGLDLAQRFFSPGEAAALKALPAEERQRAFFDYWTLKEAYVKALGLGLVHPLSAFEMRLDREIRIAFTGDAGGDPGAWHFALWHPGELHHLALAVRRTPGELLHTQLRPLTLESLTDWFHE